MVCLIYIFVLVFVFDLIVKETEIELRLRSVVETDQLVCHVFTLVKFSSCWASILSPTNGAGTSRKKRRRLCVAVGPAVCAVYGVAGRRLGWVCQAGRFAWALPLEAMLAMCSPLLVCGDFVFVVVFVVGGWVGRYL